MLSAAAQLLDMHKHTHSLTHSLSHKIQTKRVEDKGEEEEDYNF
jgi:hypothetical protein